MNQRKYFLKEKQLLTLQTKATLKEPKLAVIRPKRTKKGGKRNQLPVVVRSTREKMTSHIFRTAFVKYN